MNLRLSSKSIDLKLYRDTSMFARMDKTLLDLVVEEDAPCPQCLGVLQHCDDEAVISKIASKVKHDDFEARDFKINFTLSIVPMLNKVRFRYLAEDAVGTKLEGHEKQGNETSGTSI